MYLGIGFAFTAAPILILDVVSAELRGQSTAVNLILRNVGSSIGLQLAAAVVTASAVASGVRPKAGTRVPSRENARAVDPALALPPEPV